MDALVKMVNTVVLKSKGFKVYLISEFIMKNSEIVEQDHFAIEFKKKEKLEYAIEDPTLISLILHIASYSKMNVTKYNFIL